MGTSKMKILVLCALVAAAAAWPSFGGDESLTGFQSDATSEVSTTKRQHDVNHLLNRIYDHLHDGELKQLAETFDPEADTSLYSDDGAAVHTLMVEVRDHRILEKEHWFSLFNERHRQEALMLFDVFIHCKSWTCLVSNAAYFRERMNSGEFVYALYVAVIHSELGNHIVLPALYEVTPHMFTNSEIIQKAYTAMMTRTPSKFKMEFTGSLKNPEQRVAYFGEGIGMNVHHVTWHMDLPFWWNDSYGKHLDRKGELFFWAHHQLTARFDVERLSNWLDFVDELHWDHPIIEGFAPHTSYKYGGEFPPRPDNAQFEDVDGVARVRDMIITESRIRDAIAHGYIVDKEGNAISLMNEHGIDILGDIIESSVYSPNVQYYGALHNMAHIMLGRQGDPHGKFNMPPGVMEHFETATRDPSFFRLHRYMDNIFKEHKDTLPPYTQEQLTFQGVAIDNLVVEGRLETYFEDFEFDLSNAVDHPEDIEDVPIKASVNRLNHRAFSYNIDILNNNDHDVLSSIRIYLCPRYDNRGQNITFESGRWTCIEMDKFWKSLSAGANHVVRKSSESSVTVPDVPSFRTIMEETDLALESGQAFDMQEYERSCGIPNRILLPKGKTDGMKFYLAVYVSDGSQDRNTHKVLTRYFGQHVEGEDLGGTHSHCGVHGEVYPDKRPLGFPFDRRIPDERVLFNTPNMMSTIVEVYHDTTHH